MLKSLVEPFQKSLLRASDMPGMFRNQGAAFLYDLFIWQLEEFKADVKAEVAGEFDKRHIFDPKKKFEEYFNE